jgi:hypothetical protein
MTTHINKQSKRFLKKFITKSNKKKTIVNMGLIVTTNNKVPKIVSLKEKIILKKENYNLYYI